MNSGISTKMRTAAWLLREVDEGRIGLPDFQRRFEWTAADARSFLSTVLAGYPSGTLLVADNSSLEVSLRSLEAAPRLRWNAEGMIVLLDGQQRLTSLYQAMFEVGPDRYAVDFTALNSGADILEDNVVVSFPAYRYEHEFSSAAADGRVLVPFSALAEPATFFSWLHNNGNRMAGLLPGDVLGEIFAQHISPVDRYSIPVTEIAGDLSVSTVARMFERLNKSGQRLDAFDLLVARLQGSGWNLREAWDRAQEAYPELGRVLGNDGLVLASALSIYENLDTRRSSVLALSPSSVARKWDDLVFAASDVTRLLLQLGVRRPELLPNDAVAKTAIACRLAGVSLDHLEQYFWRSSASRRYEVASNTRSVADFRDLADGVSVASLFPDWEPDIETISRNTRRSNKSLWATLIALMLGENPLDLLTGQLLTFPDPEREEKWQLMPLAKGGNPIETEHRVPFRLRTAAQLFVGRQRNRSIGNLGLSGVIRYRYENPELPYTTPSIDECLDSQLMPRSGFILGGDLDDIVRFRSERLLHELRRKASY